MINFTRERLIEKLLAAESALERQRDVHYGRLRAAEADRDAARSELATAQLALIEYAEWAPVWKRERDEAQTELRRWREAGAEQVARDAATCGALRELVRGTLEPPQ